MKYLATQREKIPRITGVYKFYDKRGKIIYVGKAKDLKKRIGFYFQDKKNLDAKTFSLREQIKYIKIVILEREFEALVLESRLIARYQPKYNLIWKDERHYIYIKITADKYPRVLLSRKSSEKLYGPFPSTRIAGRVLLNIRKIFPYCAQNPRNKKACFYRHLSLCSPCPAEIMMMDPNNALKKRKEYLKNIRNIKNLLSLKTSKLQTIMIKKMNVHSKNKQYEKAREIRDKLNELNNLLRTFDTVSKFTSDPYYTVKKWSDEQNKIYNLLKLYFPNLKKIHKIECYDISNISGLMTAGSLVVFRKGVPDKDFYRRFKIRAKRSADDFSSLQEVIRRRMKHTEWSLPELMVIDGGKPQIIAVMEVLSNLGCAVPVVGLAKKNEELVIYSEGLFKKILLPGNSQALHLVQRLRDEAHRFAHNYHQKLRIKELYA